MSPEICAKEAYEGKASDVWAAGIVLYTMLFGQQPFRAANEKDLFKKILKGSYSLPKTNLEGSYGVKRFEGYPDIKYVSEIEGMMKDILNIDENKRITAADLLDKYSNWFN